MKKRDTIFIILNPVSVRLNKEQKTQIENQKVKLEIPNVIRMFFKNILKAFCTIIFDITNIVQGDSSLIQSVE